MKRSKEILRSANFSGDLDYDIVLVTVEDNLVHTKSGNKFPRNIADFMPDYNLWYALKFCKTRDIWVVESHDTTEYRWNAMSLGAWETKYSFITTWLSQMIDNLNCHKMYSVKGNWIPGWSLEGEEIPDLIKKWTKGARKILFIDNDSGTNKEYIEKKGYLEYTTKSEFIRKYNKNPRVYEKK